MAAAAKKAGIQWRVVEWPKVPGIYSDASSQLKKMYILLSARLYRNRLTAERKVNFNFKLKILIFFY